MKEITDRISRVTGQLESVQAAIVEDRDCADVIPQLLAVKGAIDAMVRAYLEAALDSCVDDDDPER